MIEIRLLTLVRFFLLYYIGWYTIYGEITEMAPNGIGFRHLTKYYKIVGPVGEGKDAFKEEEEKEAIFKTKEETDDKEGFEVELQKEEDEFLDYIEQRKIATRHGKNPDEVKETNIARQFEADYKVDKSKKRRRKKGTQRKNRSKRFAVQDPDKYWDLGIVPYRFTSGIKEENILAKIRAQNRFHYWTCIRYVPWNSGIGDKYGLNHDNYLEHIEKNGCWSFVGNMRSEGQKISCCKDDTCVHELGHALGLHHEQKSPMHDDYLRINRRNIEPDKISGFNEVDPEESRTFGYFDMASTMLYSRYAFSNNGMPTMTLYDSTMEYLQTNPDPHNFYMFKEITDLYKCKDLKCGDFSIDCKNGGFVAYIRNSCTCRCPKGLDPKTGCTTLYKGDESLKNMSWPSTEFAFMKPKEGCPAGFSEGSVGITSKKGKISDKYDLASTYKGDRFEFQFCSMTAASSANDKTEWEAGQYCILSSNGFCPEGFNEGFITFGNVDVSNVQKPLPDGKFSDNTVMWHFCCREDGTWKDPLYLPTKDPFTLFPRENECQKVQDMKVEKQWFMVGNTNGAKTAGIAPNAKIVRKSFLYINVCYYWPINYDCGGIIEISEKKPLAVIKSPNFPQNYNMKQECTWTILSPEHSKVKLDFESFNIESALDDETSYPTCEDSLEIRYTLPGQPGVNYCGRKFKETVVSEVNYLGLTLFSGLTETREGFKALAKLISENDMCYTKRGEDYRGTVNVTRLFEPCLPWAKVQHCPHHAFQQSDLDDDLADNYCRNPGSGTKPWCYTHYEDCNRNYCDPCGLESCHDFLDDCDILIAEDSSFCQFNKEAHRICRQSCGFCSKEAATPVSRVKCPPPPSLDDADVIGRSTKRKKRRYNVGDTVTLQCKNGKEKETRVCLSDGSWSGGNFVCGRCPNGWIPFMNQCYKWFGSYENMQDSRDICNQHSSVMSSAKDSDEFHFLLKLRRDARSFWLGLKYDEHVGDNIWLEDGTKVTYNKFASGHSRGCAFVNKDNEWRGIGCDQLEYMAVICKMKPTDRKVCRDAREDCMEFIRKEPGACKTFHEFAWHVCPKSCNQCKDGSVHECLLPPTPENAELVYQVDSLLPGTMIEYKCKKGFSLLKGDLRRACLLNNDLTGSEPVCLQNDLIPSSNNDIELRQRSLDGNGGTAYTADNEAFRISRSGKLVTWEFYSIYDGEVALQVWRKTSNDKRYKLIGQNVIQNSGSHRSRKIEVPAKNQIKVQNGDMIGFFLPKENQGGLTFDKCIAEYTFGDFGNQKYVKARIKVSSDWKIGNVYDVDDDKGKECKVISLRAYVL